MPTGFPRRLPLLREIMTLLVLIAKAKILRLRLAFHRWRR